MFFKFCSNFKNIKYYKHSIKLKMASGVPHCHLWDIYIHIYLPTHVTLSIYVCVFAHACSFTQLCLTLCCPMDCIWLDSSVHGIFQAIIEEWVATASSRDSSWPRDWTHISYIGRWILYQWANWKALHFNLVTSLRAITLNIAILRHWELGLQRMNLREILLSPNKCPR